MTERDQPTRTDIYAFCNRENCHGIIFMDGHLVQCLDVSNCCLVDPTRLEICRVYCIRASNGDVIVVDFDQKLTVEAYPWKKHRDGHYHTTAEDDKNLYIHRLVTGEEWSLVDHTNRCKWDNRRSNLRASDPRKNRHNVAGHGGSSSYIGVTRTDRGWRARIQSRHQPTVELGTFKTELEAARVVMAARKALLGDHAYLDTLPEDDEYDIQGVDREG